MPSAWSLHSPGGAHRGCRHRWYCERSARKKHEPLKRASCLLWWNCDYHLIKNKKNGLSLPFMHQTLRLDINNFRGHSTNHVRLGCRRVHYICIPQTTYLLYRQLSEKDHERGISSSLLPSLSLACRVSVRTNQMIFSIVRRQKKRYARESVSCWPLCIYNGGVGAGGRGHIHREDDNSGELALKWWSCTFAQEQDDRSKDKIQLGHVLQRWMRILTIRVPTCCLIRRCREVPQRYPQ